MTKTFSVKAWREFAQHAQVQGLASRIYDEVRNMNSHEQVTISLSDDELEDIEYAIEDGDVTPED